VTVHVMARDSQAGPVALEPDMFESLRKLTGDSLISIYIPTHANGIEVQQDRIRFKNGVARVDGLLERAGWRPRDREQRLEGASSLTGDQDFWNRQSQGLGVFIDDEAHMIAVGTPGSVPDVSVMSHTFHLRPLVGLIDSVALPVLVLTKGGVRLYRTSTHAIDRADVDLPRSFEDVNWFIDREKQRQQHPDRAGFKRSGHGHEGGSRDEDLARYLRAVADAVEVPIGNDLLIVLGDDNLTDRFIGLVDHEAVSPANSGVTDPEDVEAIRRLASPIIAARAAERTKEAAESARSSLNTGLAITDLTDGLVAAVNGRVATLVIDAEATPRWGCFDPEEREVSSHEAQQPFSVDLLDRLVVEATATSATVRTHPGPVDGHTFVAIPRY